jgi:abhydrolase domain-containing protein 6
MICPSIQRSLEDFPLRHTARGNGPAVILVHGMAASRYDWELLAPALQLAGYRTFEVDLLGHGESHKPADPQTYTIQSVYTALENWIVTLNLQPPFFLVGHSMGGYLSLRFGLNHPECVRSLALIDPLYSINQLSPVFRILQRRPGIGIKMLARIPQQVINTVVGLDPMIGHNLPSWARQQIVIDIKRASPNILNLPRTVPDLTPELAGLQVPVQIIWGEKDLTLDPNSFPLLVSSLANAQGCAIPNCGHQPHLSRPELVNQTVLRFFSQTTTEG